MNNNIIIVCLLSGLILMNNPLSAQKLSVSDILMLSKANDDEFDTYVTKKGFKLTKKERDSKCSGTPMVTTYAYSLDGYTMSAEYFVTKVLAEGGLSQLEYQTARRTDYLELKNQLKISGFKYITSTTIEGGAVSLHYKKGQQ